MGMVVDSALYVGGHRDQSVSIDAARPPEQSGQFVWIGLLEPSEEMKAVYPHNFRQRTGRAPLDTWEIATAGLQDFLEESHRYLTHEAANVLVFSYSAHHCYQRTVPLLLPAIPAARMARPQP